MTILIGFPAKYYSKEETTKGTTHMATATALIEAATDQTATMTTHTAPGTIKPLSNLLRPPLKKWRSHFYSKWGLLPRIYIDY